MLKLSAVLIVKNEKDHIRNVLESLSGIDEIVVCDTGSVDNTVSIAREYTEKVFTDYAWNDDFAEARNHALKYAKGDWILSIDGDEILEEGGIEKIRKVIEEANLEQLHFSVEMHSFTGNNVHNLPRIFRNDEKVFWKGAAHETLFPVQSNLTDIVITYEHSTAHALDPDRMMRILEKIVKSDTGSARDLYYYAREFYYRKKYEEAVRLFSECASVSKWLPERTDALLYIARCEFYMNKGIAARETCLEVINLNPDFKEALLFMADIHYEPWKHKWLKLASAAESEDVLFKRV